MQYVIMKLRPQNRGQDANGEWLVASSKDNVKGYFTEEGRAHGQAKVLAESNPGTAFAVLSVTKVYEAKKPAKPVIIAKKLNDAGELVVDNG